MANLTQKAFARLMKREMRIAFDRGRKAARRSSSLFAEAHARAEKVGQPDLMEMLNIAQLAALFSQDLMTLSHDLAVARTPEQTHLYGRVLALTGVEGFEDFSSLLGKPMRNLCARLGAPRRLLSRLQSIHKALILLRRQHEIVFRAIRNHAIAHRDHDARLQLRWANALAPMDAARVSIALLNWCTELSNFLSELQDVLISRLLHGKSGDESKPRPVYKSRQTKRLEGILHARYADMPERRIREQGWSGDDGALT